MTSYLPGKTKCGLELLQLCIPKPTFPLPTSDSRNIILTGLLSYVLSMMSYLPSLLYNQLLFLSVSSATSIYKASSGFFPTDQTNPTNLQPFPSCFSQPSLLKWVVYTHPLGFLILLFILSPTQGWLSPPLLLSPLSLSYRYSI